MAPLALCAALALLPAPAARAAHASDTPTRAPVVTVLLDPDVEVVWLDDQIRVLDGPVLPVANDPPAYLRGTPIQVRSGFTPDTVRDVETLRF
jgi:hypothetical protein